jgi:hypothetical protein
MNLIMFKSILSVISSYFVDYYSGGNLIIRKDRAFRRKMFFYYLLTARSIRLVRHMTVM